MGFEETKNHNVEKYWDIESLLTEPELTWNKVFLTTSSTSNTQRFVIEHGVTIKDQSIGINMTGHLTRHDMSSRVTGIATVGANIINTVLDEFSEAVSTTQFSTQSAEFEIEANEGEAIHLEQAVLKVNYRVGEENELTIKSQCFRLFKSAFSHEL